MKNIEEQINNILKEADSSWDHKTSHKVISSDKILSTNSKDIKELMMIVAKKYNISLEDAAFALTNVFKKISN
jgi:hypothetical protein